MKRRDFIGGIALSTIAAPSLLGAQPATPTIGVLWPGSEPPPPPRMESFRLALRQLGFQEGQNLAIELRYARGGLQELPELAAELKRLKVDVFVTFGDLTPKLAQRVTDQTPIVAMSDDIMGAGLVSSLSHPERNITGLTIMSPTLSAKRLEVLQELKPSIKRVTAFWDPTTGASQVAYTEQAAKSLNIELRVREIRARDDIAEAYQRARDDDADAINIFASPFLSALYREMIELSEQYQFPAIYQWKEHVEAGGLVSFGPNLASLWRQAGTIVAKLLRGAAPAEIPIEQPTKFELAVNTRTAKGLKIQLPPTILVRADDLFE
jgi:putative tryptophan/tyrosine transport system substrate-binding protein